MSQSSNDLGGPNSGLARPYAKAIFELAQSNKTYSKWSDQLEFLVTVAQDANMLTAIQSPGVSKADLVELVLSVGKDVLDDEGQNLVKLLIENERMNALVQINTQFKVLRDEAEQVIEAQLITAAKVSKAEMKTIEDALSKRLGKKIKLESKVDEDLIGGAIVRAGDWVVDASIKAQLQELVGVVNA